MPADISSLDGRIRTLVAGIRKPAWDKMIPSKRVEDGSLEIIELDELRPLEKPPPMVGSWCRLNRET
jgi:hypothetical protein